MRAITPTLAAGAILCASVTGALAQSISLNTTPDSGVNWYVSEIRDGATVFAHPVYGGTTYGDVASFTIPFTDNDGVWSAQTSFTLPPGATNPVLTVQTFGVDDRAVMALNGHLVTSSGTTASGQGSMTFKDGGVNAPFYFPYESGPENITLTTGFVPGLNSIRVIVNNTNMGIMGRPVPVSNYSPSSFGMTGSVSYTPAP